MSPWSSSELQRLFKRFPFFSCQSLQGNVVQSCLEETLHRLYSSPHISEWWYSIQPDLRDSGRGGYWRPSSHRLCSASFTSQFHFPNPPAIRSEESHLQLLKLITCAWHPSAPSSQVHNSGRRSDRCTFLWYVASHRNVKGCSHRVGRAVSFNLECNQVITAGQMIIFCTTGSCFMATLEGGAGEHKIYKGI